MENETPTNDGNSIYSSTLSNNDISTRANLNYCNCVISNVELKNDLQEFKKSFVEKFSLEKQIKDFNEKDAISVFYKKGNEKILVNDEEKYRDMLENFNKINNKTIFIETKILPTYFKGEKTTDFEDEMKKIVERELNIASNNIKKCLTLNTACSNCKKVRNSFCVNCKNQIIGYLYKKVSVEENEQEEYYCELCASEVDFPLFQII